MTCLCFRISEVSTERLQGWEMVWSNGSFTHMSVWWLMIAVKWDLSWDFQLECLHVASPCVLGFLTTWWLGSKGESFKREWEPGRSHIIFYDLASEVKHCHFYYILYVEAVTKIYPVSRRSKMAYHLMEECQYHTTRRQCGMWDIYTI